MQNYDAIVVGAGNGGLGAAVSLAKAGKHVLMIEQHNLPGGVASSFRRGRFEFETALHEYACLGPEDNPGASRIMLDDLGVKLPWCAVPDTFRVLAVGRDGEPIDATMPIGKEAFIDRMESYVPGSRRSMEDFFALAEEGAEARSYLTSGKPVDSKYMQEHFPNFLRTSTYPANRVLDALKMPRRAQDILNTYWSYVAVPKGGYDEFNFFMAAMMVLMYVTYGAYIPQKTSHQLTSAFLDRFHQLGGESWFNCRAEKILFDEKGHATGVATSHGEAYSRHIICDINPSIVYGRMVPRQYIPDRELKLANSRKFSARMFIVYVGLNKTAEELGIKDYSIFIDTTADTAREYEQQRRIDTNEYYISLCYNIVNPEASPAGTCMMSFTRVFSDNSAWGDLDPRDYVRTKNRIAAQILDDFEKRLNVSIKPYIEEISVATPWTICRYAGAPHGAVYGYEMAGWDGMLPRLMMLKDDYTVPGLRFTGASGPIGDGFNAAQTTGTIIAKMTLKDMEREGE